MERAKPESGLASQCSPGPGRVPGGVEWGRGAAARLGGRSLRCLTSSWGLVSPPGKKDCLFGFPAGLRVFQADVSLEQPKPKNPRSLLNLEKSSGLCLGWSLVFLPSLVPPAASQATAQVSVGCWGPAGIGASPWFSCRGAVHLQCRRSPALTAQIGRTWWVSLVSSTQDSMGRLSHMTPTCSVSGCLRGVFS